MKPGAQHGRGWPLCPVSEPGPSGGDILQQDTAGLGPLRTWWRAALEKCQSVQTGTGAHTSHRQRRGTPPPPPRPRALAPLHTHVSSEAWPAGGRSRAVELCGATGSPSTRRGVRLHTQWGRKARPGRLLSPASWSGRPSASLPQTLLPQGGPSWAPWLLGSGSTSLIPGSCRDQRPVSVPVASPK